MFQSAVAFWTGGHGLFVHELLDPGVGWLAPVAIHAGDFASCSVELKYVLTAGILMQPVNVLRDDSTQLAIEFPIGQCVVREY